MPRFINLENKRFGRLTVVSRVHRPGPNAQGEQTIWSCRCDCGDSTVVTRGNLMSGCIQSCGCLKSDRTRQRMTKHGAANTPEYKIWKGMIARCHNKNREAYARYGAKGVSVCPEWRADFAAFIADVGPRPSPSHSLDRYPDMHGNYEPGNCRWATAAEQTENQQDSISLILDGELMSLAEAARRLGISYFSARWRYWTRPAINTTSGAPQ
jgi:hypothetical protein